MVVSKITKGIFQTKEVFRKKLSTIFVGDVVECSNSECNEWTLNASKSDPDPRKRWFVNVYIGNEDESARVNLCPKCIKHFFALEEKQYQDIERGEKLASNKLSKDDFYAQIAGR